MRALRTVIVAAATAAVVTLASTSATAVEPLDPFAVVADALLVAPDLGLVESPIEQPGGELTAALTATLSAELPRDAQGEVTIEAQGAPALTLSLPAELRAGDATVATDGTVVYPGAEAQDTSVAVRALASGLVSIQTILPSADSEHSFTYTVGDGVTPVLRLDGGVDLVAAVDGVPTVIGEIRPPWAVDANGAAVSTSYRVSGADVTQAVTPTANTVYPVVADPTYGHTYGLPTIYLTRAETRKAGGDAGTIYTICAAAGLWNAYVGFMCAANTQIINSRAKTAANQNKCLKIIVGPGVVTTASFTANCV
ncbi:MAG TPA: hypothetical protein PLS68_00775 [Actinotalea sp.]|nr:hypothetical protein [Actinotalea sp.]